MISFMMVVVVVYFVEINVFALLPCGSNIPFDKSIYRRYNGRVLHNAASGQLLGYLRSNNLQYSSGVHIECRLRSHQRFDEVGRTSWRWIGKLLSYFIGTRTGKGKIQHHTTLKYSISKQFEAISHLQYMNINSSSIFFSCLLHFFLSTQSQ